MSNTPFAWMSYTAARQGCRTHHHRRYNFSPIMESLRELFRIGNGPSSSHTMGPKKAVEAFRAAHPDAAAFRTTLYGSLAATGKGHMTDQAIEAALAPLDRLRLSGTRPKELPGHPNGMRFEALDAAGRTTAKWQGYSIGGGAILAEGEIVQENHLYPHHHLTEIMRYCSQQGSFLLGICRAVRRAGNLGLPQRGAQGHAHRHRPRAGSRRRAARRPGGFPQGGHHPAQDSAERRKFPSERDAAGLCPGRRGRERRGRRGGTPPRPAAQPGSFPPYCAICATGCPAPTRPCCTPWRPPG